MRPIALLSFLSFSAFAADAPKVVVIVPGDVVTEPGAFSPEALYIAHEKKCVDDAAARKVLEESPPVVGFIIGGVLILGAGVALGYGIAKLK